MGTFFAVGAVDDPPALLLTASGDLDLSTEVGAREELAAAGGALVVIDVSGRFVGARGMRVLVEAVNRARDAGGSCAVAGLRPDMLGRLALFDAEGLPFFRSLDDAIAGLPVGRSVPTGG